MPEWGFSRPQVAGSVLPFNVAVSRHPCMCLGAPFSDCSCATSCHQAGSLSQASGTCAVSAAIVLRKSIKICRFIAYSLASGVPSSM
jgi:hypothetical protein